MSTDPIEWAAKEAVMDHLGRAWRHYGIRIEVHEARMRGHKYEAIADVVRAVRPGRGKLLTRPTLRNALATLDVKPAKIAA